MTCLLLTTDYRRFGEGKANPVLHCPYVHSTLAFVNEQIN